MRKIVLNILLLAGVVGGSLLVPHTSGIALWGLLTGLSAVIVILLKELHELLNRIIFHRKRPLSGYWNLLLVVCSVMLIVMAFEGILQFQAQRNGEKRLLTMPEEWKRRNVAIPDVGKAYYWHGALHLFNEFGMRRTEPFTSKNPEIGRVMVLGDSLTYGKGIDANDTYPSVIESMLSQDFRIEVLNLGINGYQSEQIAELLYWFAPKLQPDVIVYGVCLNDFLDAGEEENARGARRGWKIPLPESAKQFLISRTFAGEFFNKAYDDALMRVGLRVDFISNILAGMYHYQLRFTRDVTEMNFFAVSQGFPPIVAMVLDAYPVYNGRNQQVARLAEKILELAHIDVISTEEYYKTYSGRRFAVSPWEGHPNEEAHRIFAEAFARRLREHPALQPYKR
ncbi:hypothetical protein U14_00013 [Candidatus Moduliflexus flocculans]|uniref:SGNH hydrolase-type esterase domain-containing protein n=1 Tax=Candidatus Moduliflexus flocculans TaxID=1499966 RepID=A0A0S6VV02_9BACT|nr:hypothetical protein U14_00013 [Candidatus Moduliflexus flocculans]